MKVGTRLRGAFAFYIALLAAVLVYHVRTTQHAVDSGRALADISTRLRVSSTSQITRLVQMSSDAEKYFVTHDKGYFDKFLESEQAFGNGLQSLNRQSLSAGERAAFDSLVVKWANVDAQVRSLAAVSGKSPATGRATVTQLQSTLDEVRDGTRRLAMASQDAMSEEVGASEQAARKAERLSLLTGVSALVLSLLLSALLVRSIVEPLRRLAKGTREVSAGRFDYRLESAGGDEFTQLARDFNSMTERLDELDRMKQDFVAKVSHDLKTPLSSMQETIGVLLDGLAGPLTAKQRQLLELNLDSGRRLSAMLTKLLDLSRIEAGLQPDFQMLDVAQLVKRSIDRADAARTERAFQLKFTEPEHRLLLRGDDIAITQVVDNLLENAIKFSPLGGVVSVRVSEWPSGGANVPPAHAAAVRRSGLRGSALLLEVADEGPGIPDEEKERVFTRFYQAEAGRAARGRGGVGLGLTICREIVTAHGGAIWVADNEPRGSLFCVLLPGAVAASDSRNASATTAKSGSVA
ncbi:MAG: putative two-component histidine kinase [Gemmatimonadetes bacterium]|nr:putative two-component histidine kinase [Gemmatimonadota bacterium]